MDGRGRKSAASLSVASVSALPGRLDPPDDLTATEAELWRAVVSEKPVDWFGSDNAPLLKEYVRAVAMCDLLSAQIAAALAGGETGEIKALLNMRDKESKRVASIATKLRLTQQSRYTPKSADTANRNAGSARKPWLA
jgi:hypothetical protein